MQLGQTPRSGGYITVPYFSGSFRFGGTAYPYQMVGSSPAHPASTSVAVSIVPIDVLFKSGPPARRRFNGSAVLPLVVGSPLFARVRWPLPGARTQYIDAVRRAEFWRAIHDRASYHLFLRTPVELRAVHLVVPARAGVVRSVGRGLYIGFVSGNWWEAQLTRLLGLRRLSPRGLTIFFTDDLLEVHDTQELDLAGGIHGAVPMLGPGARREIFTFVWASWGPEGAGSTFGLPANLGADIDPLAHELGEWANDPFNDNVVPPWSESQPLIGSLCSDLLESADPLVTQLFAVSRGGFVYHLQDQAFFSWFARQRNSEGYRGRFSFLGRLTFPPPACSSLVGLP
jgi:hypothetical protein